MECERWETATTTTTAPHHINKQQLQPYQRATVGKLSTRRTLFSKHPASDACKNSVVPETISADRQYPTCAKDSNTTTSGLAVFSPVPLFGVKGARNHVTAELLCALSTALLLLLLPRLLAALRVPRSALPRSWIGLWSPPALAPAAPSPSSSSPSSLHVIITTSPVSGLTPKHS